MSHTYLLKHIEIDVAFLWFNATLCGSSQGQVNQPQPQEMYQRQSGITYYSPQTQAVPRAAPQPRVKAAIPIVPPPEMTSASRQRDDGECGVEHDANALRHSPSPGHVSAPMGAAMGPAMGAEPSTAPQMPPQTPSPPSAAPPQGCRDDHTAAAPEGPVDSAAETAPAAPATAAPATAPSPERASQNEVTEEPAVQPA